MAHSYLSRRRVGVLLSGLIVLSLSHSFAVAGVRQQVVVVNPPVSVVDSGSSTTTSTTELPTTSTTSTTVVSVVGSSTTSTLPVIAAVTTTSTTPGSITSTVPDTVPVTGAPVTTTSTLSITTTTNAIATTNAATTTTTASKSGSPTTTKVAAKPGAMTVEELRTRIEAKLATSTAGTSGVMVALDGGGVLFERNADGPMIPASTQKIYVAGTALATLGPEARFVTNVFASGALAGTVLQGDLYLRTSGDPSLTSSHLAALAKGVKSAGISSVGGALLVDDSRFDRMVRVPSWKSLFTPGESGWLSSFMVDENHRNDAATAADPALANLARFRLALKSAGVTVVGGERRGTVPAGSRSVSSRSSSSIDELIRLFVKKSNNTYAELFTKELGARSGNGSTIAGVRAIAAYFDQLGVSRPVAQEDGSGLSSNDRSTAQQQVRFLQKALAGPTGAALRSSLAVSCVDGTLKSRTCGTPAEGKVFAKSGSIDFVTALTGVTTTSTGKPVTFSFLLNNVRSARLARAAIDASLVEVVSSRI